MALTDTQAARLSLLLVFGPQVVLIFILWLILS